MTPAQLQAMGFHYVLVDSDGLDWRTQKMTICDWTNRFDGVLAGTTGFPATANTTAFDYLVRLNSPGANEIGLRQRPEIAPTKRNTDRIGEN